LRGGMTVAANSTLNHTHTHHCQGGRRERCAMTRHLDSSTATKKIKVRGQNRSEPNRVSNTRSPWRLLRQHLCVMLDQCLSPTALRPVCVRHADRKGHTCIHSTGASFLKSNGRSALLPGLMRREAQWRQDQGAGSSTARRLSDRQAGAGPCPVLLAQCASDSWARRGAPD